ncbi:hypothetical protein ONE63_003478 [Megalurothrips usitatus]|uniref:C2H2-type domain-containing protein n=1 Tax=Megalurothrips usitatus TaxID=439358 RepID=A0AAV7XBM8_9NEOP|nr:hypothetical protein ONE63_003478 [Megalurothrips usitatus]
MSTAERKQRHGVKNTTRCPFCLTIFTMRSECYAHIEKKHPETLQDEGVFVVARRLYYQRREGVRVVPKRRYVMHLSHLPHLSETSRKVVAVIKNIITDCMVLVGDDSQEPLSLHMEYKRNLKDMKKFYGDSAPDAP